MEKKYTREELVPLLKGFFNSLKEQKKILDRQQTITDREILEYLNVHHDKYRLRISLRRGMIFVFGSKLTLENNNRDYYKGEEKYNLVKKTALITLYIGNRKDFDDDKNLNNVLPENPLYHFRENHRKLRSFRDGIFFIKTKISLLSNKKEVKDFFEGVFNNIKI